jgi:putative addiction module component (TIGR02574 family)
MSTTADKLEQEIKSLADVDKLRIVDAILADLTRPDPELDRIWAEEARKRWDAYKAGRLKTVSYEEVMSKYRDHRESDSWRQRRERLITPPPIMRSERRGVAMTSSTNLIEPFDASNPFHSLPPKSSTEFDGVCQLAFRTGSSTESTKT